jgi:hypothetical protein
MAGKRGRGKLPGTRGLPVTFVIGKRPHRSLPWQRSAGQAYLIGPLTGIAGVVVSDLRGRNGSAYWWLRKLGQRQPAWLAGGR